MFMYRTPIELIPAIIKGSRPSQYEGESFTALEYVSKVAVKINECITEYNEFVDDVLAEFEKFKNGELTDRDIFERRIEQMITDFKGVITLKYKEQDTIIANAISEMINGLPENIANALDQMYSNGEFDAIVYDSIANLKKDFDSIVNNTNNFQNAINQSIANMANSMEAFKGNMNTSFEELGTELRQEISEIAAEAGIADMTKTVYDSNDDGVVNDSDKLGGQLPSYYAKQQDLDTANSMIDTVRNSLNAMPPQIDVAQETATQAKNTATAAKTTADSALEEVNKKLGKQEQAYDSLRLNGNPASYYARNVDGVISYTHSKAGTVHTITGSDSENIKFIATADWNPGDSLIINGMTAHCMNSLFERVENKQLFKKYAYINCTIRVIGDYCRCFFKLGGDVEPDDITVYRGSSYPSSPKANDIFVSTTANNVYIYNGSSWTSLSVKLLTNVILNGSTTLTGGYSQLPLTSGDTSRYYTFALSSNGLTNSTTSENTFNSVGSVKPIDVTNYSKLIIDYTVSSSYLTHWIGFGMSTTRSAKFGNYHGLVSQGWAKILTHTSKPNGTYTDTIDISSLKGNHYFTCILLISGDYATCKLNIKKITLE